LFTTKNVNDDMALCRRWCAKIQQAQSSRCKSGSGRE